MYKAITLMEVLDNSTVYDRNTVEKLMDRQMDVLEFLTRTDCAWADVRPGFRLDVALARGVLDEVTLALFAVDCVGRAIDFEVASSRLPTARMTAFLTRQYQKPKDARAAAVSVSNFTTAAASARAVGDIEYAVACTEAACASFTNDADSGRVVRACMELAGSRRAESFRLEDADNEKRRQVQTLIRLISPVR